MGVLYIVLSPAQNFVMTVSIEKFIVILEIISIMLNVCGFFWIKYLTSEY